MMRSSFTLFRVWIAKRALFNKSLARFGFDTATGSACAETDVGAESVSADSGSGIDSGSICFVSETGSEANGSLGGI